ncbi:IS3 family transposase, partial [Nocardia vinacea]
MRFVDAYRGQFKVEPICEVIEFRVSTYYAAKKRVTEPSARVIRDREILAEIRWVRKKKGCNKYGAKKVWKELLRDGVEVARCTV